MTSLDFYVYVYKHPLTLVPFYVGKGHEYRAYVHIQRALSEKCPTKTWCERKILKILRETNLFPLIEFIGCSLTEQQSFYLETETIKNIGRICDNSGPLVNLTLGGEGTCGLIRSAEHSAKISKALTGRKHTEESKHKMRKPKTFTKEQHEKFKILRKEIANRPEVKAKLKIHNQNKTVSDETKEKISSTMKDKIASGQISVGHLCKTGTEHSQAKIWIIKTPSGEKIEVVALRDFCNKHEIHYSSLRNTFYTKQEIKRGKSAGWQIIECKGFKNI